MTTIRAATIDDLDALVAMGERFFAASPYAGVLPLDVRSMRQVFIAIIEGETPSPSIALVVDRGGELVGMLVGMVAPVWFDPTLRVGAELGWWIDPQERGGPAAVRLLRAFEAWALEAGVDGVVMSELTPLGEVPHASPAALFERCGYRPLERAHLKIGSH